MVARLSWLIFTQIGGGGRGQKNLFISQKQTNLSVVLFSINQMYDSICALFTQLIQFQYKDI